MLTGEGLAEYAKSRLGIPYFSGAKMTVLPEGQMARLSALYPKTVTKAYIEKARDNGLVGRVCTDCSGLIGAYRGKQIGSYQLYQTAKKRMPVVEWPLWAVGVVVWRSGHVGVYIGTVNGVPMVVEAKGIDYGVVLTRLDANWTYGLTFDDMSYNYNIKADGKAKQPNPYKEPTRIIKRFSRGEDVKWVQHELREAGFDRPFTYEGKTYGAVVVDGVAGKITDAAIRAYQQSCKITVDGKVGKITRGYLIEN